MYTCICLHAALRSSESSSLCRVSTVVNSPPKGGENSGAYIRRNYKSVYCEGIDLSAKQTQIKVREVCFIHNALAHLFSLLIPLDEKRISILKPLKLMISDVPYLQINRLAYGQEGG